RRPEKGSDTIPARPRQGQSPTKSLALHKLHCWLVNRIKAPAAINRAIRTPTTNDVRHADEAQACRRRRVFERRPFWAKGATRLPPHESGELRRRQCRVDVAEGSLVLQLVRGGDEPAHRGAIERAGEADATHASRFQLGNGERLARNADHEIERLRD